VLSRTDKESHLWGLNRSLAIVLLDLKHQCKTKQPKMLHLSSVVGGLLLAACTVIGAPAFYEDSKFSSSRPNVGV
jgi:hypothetical protein